MAYTQIDLTNIETALIDLARGNRIVKIVVEGKVCEFGQADISQLRVLRAEISAEIKAASGSTGLIYTTTRKVL
jgi:hypothetical protein